MVLLRVNVFMSRFMVPLELQGFTNNLATDLVYQCESAELPGTILHTTDYRTIGPSRKIATQTMYNELGLTFYCTSDFYEKVFFDSWIEYINPRAFGWDFHYKSEYVTNMQICQLDLTGDNITYAVQIINAFPIAVNAMPLHWQDDSIHRLNVTFAYDRYIPNLTFNNMFDSLLNVVAPFSGGLNQPNLSNALCLICRLPDKME